MRQIVTTYLHDKNKAWVDQASLFVFAPFLGAIGKVIQLNQPLDHLGQLLYLQVHGEKEGERQENRHDPDRQNSQDRRGDFLWSLVSRRVHDYFVPAGTKNMVIERRQMMCL